MDEKIKKLGELIEGAQNILVTTHKGPDPDAWTSLSIATIALRKYLKKENVRTYVTGNEKHSALTDEYERLNETQLLSEDGVVDLTGFDMIIMTDAHQIKRCFKNYSNLSEETVLIGIDHHEFNEEDASKLTLNFNELRSSAAEEVYRVFRDLVGSHFGNDEDIVVLTQKGIVSDTARFMYKNTTPETYELMSELTKIKRLDVEKYTLETSKFDETAIQGIALYLKNYTKVGDMGYSVVSGKEFEDAGVSHQGKEDSGQFVTSHILRNVNGVEWGFAMRESLDNNGEWSISFRANNGTREVVKIAELLNGGGHKYAAGARIKAESKEEAIQMVLDAIKETQE